MTDRQLPDPILADKKQAKTAKTIAEQCEHGRRKYSCKVRE